MYNSYYLVDFFLGGGGENRNTATWMTWTPNEIEVQNNFLASFTVSSVIALCRAGEAGELSKERR